MKLHTAAFICSLTFISPSIAADRVLAEKLVDILRYGGVVDSTLETCVDTARNTDVEAELQRASGLFGGITPSSPLWAEARQVCLTFLEAGCQAFDKDKAAAAVVRECAAGLSNDEFQEVLAFYATPAGRKSRDAGTLANNSADREAIDQSRTKQSYGTYVREIDRLISKHLEHRAASGMQGAR